MVSPTRLVGTDNWLKPATIAKVCGGRTVRSGRPARRISTDSRTVQPGDCFVALTGDSFDGHDFLSDAFARGVGGVVVSRPLPHIELPPGVFVVSVRDTGAALLALGAEHRRRHRAKVVGITGSCGKTSTKDMLGRTLESTIATVYSPRSFNNHVGVPLSLLLIEPDTEAAVIEIGTNSPGEVEQLAGIARPDIGIVTCVSEAHLSGLGSLSAVAREKAGLFRAMPEGGVAILNGDDPACRAMAEECTLRTIRVSVDQEADWFATDIRFHGLGTSFLLQGFFHQNLIL